MTTVTDSITNMQNMTATQKADEMKKRTTSSDVTDSNMFLTLMLKQLENQDPTEPTDNAQWLAQLAQYSSLEQMTQMNTGLKERWAFPFRARYTTRPNMPQAGRVTAAHANRHIAPRPRFP